MDATKGFVVPAGSGKHLDMGAPGRFAALKLVGHETNESIMLFEETVPVGTKSLFHLHRDCDEVAWVLAGEITFKISDEVTVGGPGTCAFFPRNVPHAWKSTGREQPLHGPEVGVDDGAPGTRPVVFEQAQGELLQRHPRGAA